VLRLRADVLGAIGDLSLEDGSITKARRCFESAAAIRGQLSHDYPRSLEYRMEHSVSLVRVGDAAKSAGDLNAAQTMYDRAHELDERSVDEHPESARALTLLAWSEDRLAAMDLSRHNPLPAEARYAAFLAYMQRLNRMERSADARRGLCEAHWHIGDVELSREDMESYRDHMRQALEDSEAAVELEPEDRLAHWAYLHSRMRFLKAFSDDLGPERSRQFCEETLIRSRKLVQLDPTDEPLHGCYMTALEAAADYAERDGETELSLSLRRDLVEEARRYLELRPTDPEAHVSLANCSASQDRAVERQKEVVSHRE
jgi:tetratricopeptide (TPR) repeat protein